MEYDEDKLSILDALMTPIQHLRLIVLGAKSFARKLEFEQRSDEVATVRISQNQCLCLDGFHALRMIDI